MSSVAENKQELRVVYSGSVQIPICIGSIAIPLSSSSLPNSCVASPTSRRQTHAQTASFTNSHQSHTQTITLASSHLQARSARSSRCTHRRYCYIRDGSAIEHDAFYRWLEYSAKTLKKQKNQPTKRHRQESAVNSIMKQNATNHTINDQWTSPSLFYAMIDHVVFTMPRSFPSPRRIIRSAPFLIVDDAWAAHSIDIQIHFLPSLAIPPLTFVHVVHLHRLLQITPKLLSVHHGEWTPCNFYAVQPINSHNSNESNPKQLSSSSCTAAAAAAAAASVTTKNEKKQSHQQKQQTSSKQQPQPTQKNLAEALVQVNEAVHAANEVVIMQRKDAIRIFHPTLRVVQFVKRVLCKVNAPIIESLRAHFVQNVYPQCILHNASYLSNHTKKGDQLNTSIILQTNDKCKQWMLPNEKQIAEYTHGRPSRANNMLRKVLQNLKEEQTSLWAQLTTSLRNISQDVRKVHSKLDDMHQLCTSLQR